MANLHHVFNPTSKAGSRLRAGLDDLERSIIRIVREVTTMNAMLSGNGSDPSHFGGTNGVTESYGFESDEQAKAGRDELVAAMRLIDSLGDDSNITGAFAEKALDQAFSRLR